MSHFQLPPGYADSFVLVEDGKLFTRSDAALKVARRLDGIVSLLNGFIIVPRFIRNPVYDFIARNRYKWFGKRQECMVPEPGVADRFLN